MQFLERNGLLLAVKKHLAEQGGLVQAGPFTGMIYPHESALVRWCVPKLLGTYEQELHSFLSKFSRQKYDCILDIGSAEGYYACGLARIFRVPVYAYDPEPYERRFSALMAQQNGVGHLVHMANLFTQDDMKRFASQRALVVCDCEGFEEMLFTSDTLAFTQNWDLMIELHGSADAILPELGWPHTLTLINLEHRTGLQDEYRPYPQRFLICEATLH